MEKTKKEPKKNYNVLSVIKRMLIHMWEQDRKQYGRIAVYTLVGAAYPFLGVFLPKIAIGILEKGGETAVRDLFLAMAIYFVVAGILVSIVCY